MLLVRVQKRLGTVSFVRVIRGSGFRVVVPAKQMFLDCVLKGLVRNSIQLGIQPIFFRDFLIIENIFAKKCL